jgi:NAD(P)-dependent dehydrogenase (short-subunit alcohol dehydrogenase family)
MEEKNKDGTPRLKSRVAIVTGGASGIGLATCCELVKEGATVVLVDLDQSRVDKAVKALQANKSDLKDHGSAALGLALDVRCEQDMEQMSRTTLQSFGRIDILIASAGILRSKGSSLKMLVQTPVSEWDEVVDTNLKGVFLSNRAVLQTMIEQRSGHIINISSTSGRQGRAFDSAYCASKFGVIGLSESVAQEVSRYGIKVSTILPDAVDTPLWEQNGPISRPDDILPPERIANLVVYMLTLPDDTLFVEPVIGPFRSRRRMKKGPTTEREPAEGLNT